MSDYIDRAALGIGLCNRDVFENKSYADGWNAAVKILKEAPTADIPEVTHGHGKWIPISDGDAAECSECGEYFDVSENGGMASFHLFEKFYKYCPNCGAKMDAEAITSANVEPVVRCKDCKKSSLTEFGKRYCSEPMGAFYGCIPVEDNFFCSGGKKLEAIDDE